MKIAAIETQLQKARARVSELEAQFAAARLTELRKVTVSKKRGTITLTFGARVIQAKRHARFSHRWNLFENGKRIATEVMAGIHDIRFAIAIGHI